MRLGAMRRIALATIVAVSLGATPVGPRDRAAAQVGGANGSLDLFANVINTDGTAGAVDFNACGAPVTVLFDGSLGRLSFSLYTRLAGGTASGIAGLLCYLRGLETGLPPGWTVDVFYAPGTDHVGDLVRPHVSGIDTIRGDLIRWSVTSPADPNCQGGV